MLSRNIGKKILKIGVLGSLVIFPSLTEAQEKFPAKSIELVVPFAAGGSTDVLARTVAKLGPKYFGKPLVVVNKPGGGGVIGAEAVVRAKPDGYSLYIGYGSGNDLLLPHLQKMPFDPLKDLTPVCRLSDHSVAMVIRPDAPYKNLKEFIDWAKKRDKVTASIAVKGGTVDLFFQVVGQAIGIKFVQVPFRGGAEAVTSILGGHTDCGAGHPSEIITHIKAKRLIPVAIAFDTRDPALPDVPTFGELGYSTPSVTSTKGVGAPRGISPEVVQYLSERFKKVCEDPEFIKSMKDIGQPVLYLGPLDFAKFLKNKYDLYARLTKEFNLILE